ncbi:hypothetical protein CEB3_c30140 [Peptococcaceae bacterium CEB3]|nr:hypothetical protein CEB3_c30140 [Peptococcaceae bacterium CEB3]
MRAAATTLEHFKKVAGRVGAFRIAWSRDNGQGLDVTAERLPASLQAVKSSFPGCFPKLRLILLTISNPENRACFPITSSVLEDILYLSGYSNIFQSPVKALQGKRPIDLARRRWSNVGSTFDIAP